MRWIVGYEGSYMAHRDGRIFNASAREMSIRIDRYGYANVRLSADGRQSWKKVARLVAEAWHGPPPVGRTQAAHLDGNRLNNGAENIAWKSPKENSADRLIHGTHRAGARHPRAKLCVEQVAAIRASGLSSRAAARAFGISQTHVVHIRNGVRWGEAIALTLGNTKG